LLVHGLVIHDRPSILVTHIPQRENKAILVLHGHKGALHTEQGGLEF